MYSRDSGEYVKFDDSCDSVESGNFYRTQVSLGSDLWVRLSLRPRRFADLTDVTLVDEDTKSILTDNANT